MISRGSLPLPLSGRAIKKTLLGFDVRRTFDKKTWFWFTEMVMWSIAIRHEKASNRGRKGICYSRWKQVRIRKSGSALGLDTSQHFPFAAWSW